MKKESIVYFEKPGPENTKALMELIKQKALEAKPEGATVISSGRTGKGVDAAVLMKAFGYEKAQKNRVNEIIAMVSN